MKCVQCGKEFEISVYDEQRGRGKYCSRECFYASKVGRARPELLRRIRKICLVCGKEFETGGRAGDKDQRYCSQRCNALARVHTAKVNKLSDTDAAYLAGLIDGEGSIVAAKQRQQRITWRLVVSNTDFDLLQWCMNVTGCGSIVRHHHQNLKHHDIGAWQCYSWNARDILKQILPYMKIVEKVRRAQQMIAELDNIEVGRI